MYFHFYKLQATCIISLKIALITVCKHSVPNFFGLTFFLFHIVTETMKHPYQLPYSYQESSLGLSLLKMISSKFEATLSYLSSTERVLFHSAASLTALAVSYASLDLNKERAVSRPTPKDYARYFWV